MEKTTALLIALSVLLTATAAVSSAPGVPVGEDTYYISDHGVLYKEANGCDGLQEAMSDCDGDGMDESADERVAPR